MAGELKAPLIVMVSSTVYQKEPLLDQVDAMLRDYGYRVWMSHKGSVPLIPGQNAFASCLVAVERCDVYLGIITPQYGSGIESSGDESITHRELKRALELNKPRFLLAHEQVVNARRLLLDIEIDRSRRADFKVKKGGQIIDDLRLIDMYEEATQECVPIAERTDNWVQKYRTNDDVIRFVDEQFGNHDQLQMMIDGLRPAERAQ